MIKVALIVLGFAAGAACAAVKAAAFQQEKLAVQKFVFCGKYERIGV